MTGDVLALELTLADEAELFSLSGLTPRDALLALHASSATAVLGVTRDGRVAYLLGARPDGPSALVWAYPGPAGYDHAAVRSLQHELRAAQDLHGTLHGYVDERNRARLRWLGATGFQFIHALLGFGQDGRTFYEYAF